MEESIIKDVIKFMCNHGNIDVLFKTENELYEEYKQMNIENTESQQSSKPSLLIDSVNGSVCLTENQIAELAQIGSQHLYLGAMDEGRISYGGIMEILKRYEELRKTDEIIETKY